MVTRMFWSIKYDFSSLLLKITLQNVAVTNKITKGKKYNVLWYYKCVSSRVSVYCLRYLCLSLRRNGSTNKDGIWSQSLYFELIIIINFCYILLTKLIKNYDPSRLLKNIVLTSCVQLQLYFSAVEYKKVPIGKRPIHSDRSRVA